MALPGSDTFEGTANPIGGNWSTCDDAYGIQKNGGVALPAGSNTVQNLVYWNADAFDNDQYASGILGSSLANDPALIVRQRNSDDKYYVMHLHANGARVYVQYYNGAGTWTSVTGGTYETYSVATGSEIEIRVEGTTISVWDDGVQIKSNYTDANIDSGSAGFGSNYSVDYTTALFTSVEVGNISAGGTTVPQTLMAREHY